MARPHLRPAAVAAQGKPTRLQFLGATGTVSGSKYLLQFDGRQVLVDCGLFQGYKQLRLRNWTSLPVAPKSLDAVVLTHAHIDHSGYLPLLVRNGFRGRILCTRATRDLCGVLLPDSARLQEEEADYANRRGYSKHKPALPLYTEKDAAACLRQFAPLDLGQHTLRGLLPRALLHSLVEGSGQHRRRPGVPEQPHGGRGDEDFRQALRRASP